MGLMLRRCDEDSVRDLGLQRVGDTVGVRVRVNVLVRVSRTSTRR